MNPNITQPALGAEALDEFRTWMREGNDFDKELLAALTAATLEVQQQTSRQLLQATCVYTLDWFPAVYALPPVPLVSITSVTYLDTSGSRVTWDSSNYDVLTDIEPGIIRPIYNGTLPQDTRSRPEPIATYVAGHGTNWTAVPQNIRDVVMMRAETIYRGTEWGDIYDNLLHSLRIGDEHLAYPQR